MQLFTPDLYRALLTGFAIGALGLVTAVAAQGSGRGLADAVIPAAEAAPALPDQTR